MTGDKGKMMTRRELDNLFLTALAKLFMLALSALAIFFFQSAASAQSAPDASLPTNSERVQAPGQTSPLALERDAETSVARRSVEGGDVARADASLDIGRQSLFRTEGSLFGRPESSKTPVPSSSLSRASFMRAPAWADASDAVQAQPQNAVAPLSAPEKIKHGFRSAFLSPQAYITPAFSATITQLREEEQPQKDSGDKAADWLSRYAINFGTRSTKTLLGSGLYPALFKQDPRYMPSGKHGFGPRALYAASRVFVTRGDNGRAQFNASRIAGNLSAAALANIWERSTPGHDRIGVNATFGRFYRGLAFDALSLIVFKEFWPDIRGLFKR